MDIVTQSQLKRITGSADPFRQADLLRRHGIMPIIRVDGKLTVFNQALIRAQLVTEDRAEEQPNWDNLDGTA